jgi:hypothetical protein
VVFRFLEQPVVMAGNHESLATRPGRSKSSSRSSSDLGSRLPNTESRRQGTTRSEERSRSRSIQSVSHIGRVHSRLHPDDQCIYNSDDTTNHDGVESPKGSATGSEKNKPELGLAAVKDVNERQVDLEKGAQQSPSDLGKSNSPQQDPKLVCRSIIYSHANRQLLII